MTIRVPKDLMKAPIQSRPVKIIKASPCALELTAMFNCWRSFSQDSSNCAVINASVVNCMKAYSAKRAGMKGNRVKKVSDLNRELVKVYRYQ